MSHLFCKGRALRSNGQGDLTLFSAIPGVRQPPHVTSPATWIFTFVRWIWQLSHTALGEHVLQSPITSQDRHLLKAKAELQKKAAQQEHLRLEQNQASDGTALPALHLTLEHSFI